MSRVVVDAWRASFANARHHVWHHWAQSGPWNDPVRVYSRKEFTGPINQGPDPIISDVAVVAVEFSRAGNAEPAIAEPAGNDLRSVIKQTDPRRGRLGALILKVHSYRIPFDRIDVQAIAEHCCELTACRARTDYNTIGLQDLLDCLFRSVVNRVRQTEAVAAIDTSNQRVVFKSPPNLSHALASPVVYL